ncbi:hypothetical protein DD238_007848 [Peronospora effusa]|uniref:Peptidase S54 rhomboid domain-containing protein n=1 Tax=Peronospora effusa TaxID=542832 RepID=A0A3M6V7M0_9STRA|nr:hypothetical protein DD238_007848 [Peronospora effusa]
MRLFRRKKVQERSTDRNDDGESKTSDKRDVGDIPPPLFVLLNSVQEMDRKPPVTLVLIGVMYLLHVQASRTPSLLLPFALCPEKVVATKSMEAVFIAPFIHFEDFHLYQSLVSLLWKGYKLEGRLGSIGFCVLLLYLIALSQALIVFGAHLISWVCRLPGTSVATREQLKNISPDFPVSLPQ